MPDLLAHQLAADPRFAEAKAQILQTLADYQKQLTGPRPPRAELQQSYEQALEQFAAVRGGKLFYPYLGTGMGSGSLVELGDGSVKYDMIIGIGVHFLGHGHPRLVEAALNAAVGDTVMQGNLQQNVESFELSQLLLEHANESGATLDHCFLTTSGAMANENALKIAFQKHQPADRVLAFEHCFMGRTMALAHITDKAKYRVGLPQTINTDYVPFFDTEHPAQSTAAAVEQLKEHIHRHPGRHAVMCLEVIQGEGGYYAGDRDFFLAIIDVLRANNIAVYIDEVQTFGRTHRMFGFQHYKLDEFADIVTIGKMSQVCATLYRDEYTPKPGLVSQTFTGSTSSIHAAKAVIQELVESGSFGDNGRTATFHQRFVDHFKRIAARHPGILQGSHGLGGMIAFTPFDGSADAAQKLLRRLFENGVIAFVAGGDPVRLRFLPPVPAMTEQQVDEVCEILETSLLEVAEQLSSAA